MASNQGRGGKGSPASLGGSDYYREWMSEKKKKRKGKHRIGFLKALRVRLTNDRNPL